MKYLNKTIGSLAGILLLASCAGKLDITPPNSITDEQITELMESGDDATVTMIMNAIAAPMITYFNYSGINGTASSDGRYRSQQGLDYMRNLEGNDIVFGDNNNGLFGMAEYQFNNFTSADVDKNSPYWYCGAIGINKANQLLGYMTKEMADARDDFKDGRVRGLAVRAFEYLSLAENYQDAYLQGGENKLGLSLYDTYDPLQDNKARSTLKETYDFIKADLEECVDLLNAAGTGYTTDNLEDFDLGLINFLRARTYLECGDYSDAITACNAIINSGAYSFIKQENYGGHNTGEDMTGANIEILPHTNAFLSVRNNPETILGFIRTSSYNLTTFSSWLNPFGTGYGGSSRGYARIDNVLYEKISDDDFRQDCFYTGEVGDFYYEANTTTSRVCDYINLKFANTHGLSDDGMSSTTKANVGNVEFCKFRLSEVYLMLAEAYLGNGNESAAISTLNTLLAARTREGATTLTCDNYPSMSGLTTLEKIQLQWRIEMWGEGGREFYNNKRWNIPVDRTGSSNHVTKSTYPVSGMTLEIPEDEINTNPLCVQN